MTHRLDAAALVLNHILLVGRTTTGEDLTEVEISSASLRQVAPVQASCRFEMAERKPRRSLDSDAVGFIAACPLEFDFAKHIAAQPTALVNLGSHRRIIGRRTSRSPRY